MGTLARLLAVASLVLLAGCTHPASTPAPAGPATSAPPSGVSGLGGASTLSYPDTAQAYAEAIVAAWHDRQSTRVGQLTTPEASRQLAAIPDSLWVFAACEGASGSTYCTFRSDTGDEIVLRLRNDLLGQPGAGIGVTFDPTTYPATGEPYVSAFLTAWQHGNRARMLALSGQNTVEFVTHYTPPDSPALTSDGAAGHSYVHVTTPAGFDMTIAVLSARLGQPHAIECAVLGAHGC